MNDVCAHHIMNFKNWGLMCDSSPRVVKLTQPIIDNMLRVSLQHYSAVSLSHEFSYQLLNQSADVTRQMFKAVLSTDISRNLNFWKGLARIIWILSIIKHILSHISILVPLV